MDLLRPVRRAIDSLKSDATLIREEQALFAQIEAADEHEVQTSEVIHLPRRVFNSQTDKMIILCQRGHVTSSDGGWES